MTIPLLYNQGWFLIPTYTSDTLYRYEVLGVPPYILK